VHVQLVDFEIAGPAFEVKLLEGIAERSYVRSLLDGSILQLAAMGGKPLQVSDEIKEPGVSLLKVQELLGLTEHGHPRPKRILRLYGSRS
jgi:hypothetical protein